MGQPHRLALDTNALAKLTDGGELGAAALAKLTSQVKNGEVQLIAGYALMTELASLAASNVTVYTRQMHALRELAGGRLLLPYTQRIRKEAARRGLLPDSEAFQEAWISTGEFSHWRPTDLPVIHRATIAEKQKAEYERIELEWKERFRQLSSGPFLDRFEAAADDEIDDWVRTEVFGRLRDKYGLPSSAAESLTPRQVPSARAEVAYHVARAYLQLRELERNPNGGGRKIKASDYFDNVHFIDAMYAHEFVTDDTGFHDIISRTGSTGVVMSRFHDWATRFLSER
jgi:hypothetical protein